MMVLGIFTINSFPLLGYIWLLLGAVSFVITPVFIDIATEHIKKIDIVIKKLCDYNENKEMD